MRKPRPLVLGASLALTTAFAISGHADALTTKGTSVSPTGVCAPTYPGNADDGLRFRPLGIYNASDSGRYISCSLPIDNRTNADSSYGSTVQAVRIRLFARNSSPDARYLDCTINTVSRGSDFIETYNVRFRVLGNVGHVETTPWYPRSDAPFYGSVNIVCLLPVHMELANFLLEEMDDDDQF